MPEYTSRAVPECTGWVVAGLGAWLSVLFSVVVAEVYLRKLNEAQGDMLRISAAAELGEGRPSTYDTQLQSPSGGHQENVTINV